MPTLDQKLQELKEQKLYRQLKTIQSEQDSEIIYQSKKYINFSSNNYLGLANHPELKEASIQATKKYGTSSGASRLITGSMSLHEELENKIASFKQTEAALLFNSGYHANIGIIPTIAKEGDFIFSDELNHASLIDGARLSKAETQIFRHNDLQDLQKKLEQNKDHQGEKLIITDSIFSMDGDASPLKEIIDLAKNHKAWILVDEAHATGIFGKQGRGLIEASGCDRSYEKLIQMGTLGKALGSFGAYVAGSKSLIDFLINKSRSFIYTTSLPPSVLAASLKAFELIETQAEKREILWNNISYFKKALIDIIEPSHSKKESLRLIESNNSPIFPLILGDEKETITISKKLFEQGLWVTAIRPPTVAKGSSRLRITLMATHCQKQLNQLIQALKLAYFS